ncbi:MAG: hypothetical protein NVSMB25_20420 [Thermoleophilaceae bacterium]
MSKKADKSAKGRKGSAAAGASAQPNAIKLSEHPRAQRQIRHAKSWAALFAFGFASYAAWHGGTPFVETIVRGLMWGVAAYLLVWACAVQAWRHLAVAEVRAAEKIVAARRREAEEIARARLEETLLMRSERGA